MFFDGKMYNKAIAELMQRFGNPTLISKSLIKKFLEVPAFQDENTSIPRLFVDNLHNFVRTLKPYGQEADSRASANIQQIIPKIPPKIALRWSRRKLELREVDLKGVDKWLETEVQVQEMAHGCASTKENPEKEKPQSNSNKSKWFKKKKDVCNDTHGNSGAKLQCFVCKGEHALTLCETWKRLTVNEGWELVGFVLSFPQKEASS